MVETGNFARTREMQGNQHTKEVADTASVTTAKSFVNDTADKMQIAPRTVRRKIQMAKNLTPEVKAIVKEHGISEKSSEKLARIKEPEQQKKAAEKLASGEPIEKATKSNGRGVRLIFQNLSQSDRSIPCFAAGTDHERKGKEKTIGHTQAEYNRCAEIGTTGSRKR